jgi:nondiscriminating aspartyl-tRNA synthetase
MNSEEVLFVMTLPRTLTRDLPQRVGDEVRLQGWIHRRRRLASVTFCVLRDRSGLGQVVVKDPAELRQLDELGEETVIDVTGTAVANPQAPGGVEIVEPTLRPLTDPAEPSPVELWRPSLTATLPTLLDNAPTTWRHPRRQAVWQLAAATLHGFRSALLDLDFTEVQTPKVVGTATESGANVFGVDWFGTPAYLAQSPQFYKQTLVGVFERVFEVGPVFRAEPHDTVRHLAEYVSLDAEFGFIDDHRDVLKVLREVVAGMVDAVATRAAPAVEQLELTLPVVPETIPLLHFRDALKMLRADPDEVDLSPEHERALGRWGLEEHGSDFVAVEGYPMAKRPFYTHPDPERPAYSNGFDLLFRGIELVTGGQRLHQYEDYLSALNGRGESTEPYQSYLDVFRRGMPPHGGFAIGLERFLMRLSGAANVREVTLFPRDLNRLTP